MTIYRRKKDSDTWHWCTNCRDWPTTDYVEKEFIGRPTTGELDNIFLAKEKAGNCDKKK